MKTKKRKIFLIIAVIMLFSSLYFNQNVTLAGDKSDEGEKKIQESVDKEINMLDTSDLQNFFDGLTDDEKKIIGNGDVKNLIKSAINGTDGVTFQSVINAVTKYAADSALGFLPAIISVVIISVLYGMLSNFNDGFLDKSVNNVVYFACYGAALVILMNEIVSIVNMTLTAAANMRLLMQGLFPLLITLMTALGGATSAGYLAPLMAAAAGFIVGFIVKFVIPCFIASVMLAVAGNLSDAVKLNKMSSFFKKIAEWSLGLVFGVFITLLTAKGIVGKTADGIAVNATKFALSSYVPILGGYVSDGFDVVMAGCVLVKNAVGVTGLFIMLSVVLLPVVKLAVFSLALRFAAAAAEPVGDGKMSDLLHAVSKSAGLLIASLVGLAFLFFAVVTLVGSSCNLGVI